jgi:hypothetical protein
MAKYLYKEIKKHTDILLNKFQPPVIPKSSFFASNANSAELYDESIVQSYTKTMSGAKIAIGKRIMGKLMSKLNLTRVQAAALVGNFYAESGFVPSSLQYTTGGGYTLAQAIKGGYGKKGYGFAQWTFRTRQKSLLAFLDSKYGVGNGANHVMTEDDNIEFIVYELTKDYPSQLARLKAYQFSSEGEHHVLVDATMYILEHYENPDILNKAPYKRAERIGYAKQLLDN